MSLSVSLCLILEGLYELAKLVLVELFILFSICLLYLLLFVLVLILLFFLKLAKLELVYTFVFELSYLFDNLDDSILFVFLFYFSFS